MQRWNCVLPATTDSSLDTESENGRLSLSKRPGFITLLGIGNFLFSIIAFFFCYVSFINTEPIWGALFALLGILWLLTGYGLLALRRFAYTVELIFNCLGLALFPFGTIACVLVINYLRSPQIKGLFSAQPGEEFQSQPFTGRAMIVTLLFFAQIVLIAAILIPGQLGGHSPQKRTIADMRSVYIAVESFSVDNNFYPDAHSIEELAGKVEPTYIKEMPEKDAWGNPFRYDCWKEKAESKGCDNYVVASPGKDGVWEQTNVRNYKESTFEGMNGDIVIKNGLFLRYPAGIAVN